MWVDVQMKHYVLINQSREIGVKNKGGLADAESCDGRIKKYRVAYSPLARQKHHTNSSRFVVVVDDLSSN